MPNNVLDYLIKIKAEGSSVTSTASQVIGQMGRIEAAANKVGSSMREALSFKNFKSSLMSIPGMQFLTNPYVAIAAGVGAVTKLGAEAEMTSTSFAKLVGDEQKAADTLAQIKEYANKTPYESMDLIESAKQMLSFGVSTEQTVNMMKRLGDISMGDKEKMSSLSLVYSQVASQGKMMGQDFLQFVNAGFNPIQELSEMTGKTTAELKDMMSKGQIGETAVAAAIEHATNAGGKFAGMSEALADTTAGKFSTLVGQFKEMGASLFEALQPMISVLMDAGMVIVNDLAGGIQVAVAWTRNFITQFRPFLTLIARAASLVYNFGASIAKVVYGALGSLLNTLGAIGNAIARLFGITGNTTGGGGKKTAKTQQQKQTNKVQTPSLIGSANLFTNPSGGKGGKKGKGSKSKDANEIATGGTRNTNITMTITKFFDNLQVTMMEKTDTQELETIVVQSMNRALAIATSTDR